METGQPRAPAGEAPSPNSEAIAWYVEEAQRLLEDQKSGIASQSSTYYIVSVKAGKRSAIWGLI